MFRDAAVTYSQTTVNCSVYSVQMTSTLLLRCVNYFVGGWSAVGDCRPSLIEDHSHGHLGAGASITKSYCPLVIWWAANNLVLWWSLSAQITVYTNKHGQIVTWVTSLICLNETGDTRWVVYTRANSNRIGFIIKGPSGILQGRAGQWGSVTEEGALHFLCPPWMSSLNVPHNCPPDNKWPVNHTHHQIAPIETHILLLSWTWWTM